MVPSAIVAVDALPRTPNGKIDRKRLPAADRAPSDAIAKYTAPANEVEVKIAAVWQEVLNLERVGAHDNFFDLGANSLLVMQANGKLRQALGKEISLVEMFRFTTVSTLAEHLAGDASVGPSFVASRERARARGDAMQRRAALRSTR
jgi:acyl carrier protein